MCAEWFHFSANGLEYQTCGTWERLSLNICLYVFISRTLVRIFREPDTGSVTLPQSLGHWFLCLTSFTVRTFILNIWTKCLLLYRSYQSPLGPSVLALTSFFLFTHYFQSSNSISYNLFSKVPFPKPFPISISSLWTLKSSSEIPCSVLEPQTEHGTLVIPREFSLNPRICVHSEFVHQLHVCAEEA